MGRIPIFIYHEGNPKYLKKVIEFNQRNNDVFLLGDSTNCEVTSNWIDINKYVPREFGVLKECYVHMSTNAYDYELNCFKRYFVMMQYMRENRIDKAIHFDSDCLAFYDLSTYFENCECKAAMTIPKTQEPYIWTCGPQSAYWTLEYLEDFVRFIIDTYTNKIGRLVEKYKYHQEHNLDGGICDMTLLYLWSLEHKIKNTAITENGACFDLCIAISENYDLDEFEYDTFWRIKRLLFDKNLPIFINKNGEKIRTYTLHCQGDSKVLIDAFIHGQHGDISTGIYRFLQYIKKHILKL